MTSHVLTLERGGVLKARSPGPEGFQSWPACRSPARVMGFEVDVEQANSAVRLMARLPGVASSSLRVSLDDDVLTIRGERRFKRIERRGDAFHVVPRPYAMLRRSVWLPFLVKAEAVSVTYEDGVLTVVLPRRVRRADARAPGYRSRGTAMPPARAPVAATRHGPSIQPGGPKA